MFHSRLFATSPVYRAQSFLPPHLDGNQEKDRPTFVQFCSNEPEDILAAAKLVQEYCDAVDLNLGCPQGIARKGHYGAFLQEDWDLIHRLINTLHLNLDVPVTAKIRILDTKERSLEYAQMVVNAGAQVLTVHGRTRDQKGHNTGLADWSVIKYIRDNIPREVVMFANGNILWHEDIDRCLAETGVDGVMSAEGNLYNPAIFETSKDWDKRFPRVDVVGKEYIEIIRQEILPHLPLQELLGQEPTKRTRKKMNEILKDSSLTAIKSHLFKLWHVLLHQHTEVRDMVARATTRHNVANMDPLCQYEDCVKKVEKIVAEELRKNPEKVDAEGRWVGPDTELKDDAEVGSDGTEVVINGKRFWRRVPWYRCQPYYRPLPEEAIARGALKLKGQKENARKAECGDEDASESKKLRVDDDGVVGGDIPEPSPENSSTVEDWENGLGKD
jgi:tRNA-dihydrouridine synthase 1